VTTRLRRLRRSAGLRALVRETRLGPDRLIAPVFVSETLDAPAPVASMPGVYQWPLAAVADQAHALAELGIGAVLLFGLPARKDPRGSASWDADGVIPRAVAALKARVPALPVITDVCLCEYTDHGHCGLLNTGRDREPRLPEDYLLNDASVELLGRIALAHAAAGADLVAPSAMLDGMVHGIRQALDGGGFGHVPILSYSAKYASAFYGPFREAAGGAPRSGDRASHQMDPANAREAMREHAADAAEGADLLMVKPALAYLDVIRQTRERWPDLPLVAYSVSGEYAMLKAAVERGWVEERRAVLETLTAMRRAGADLIITYYAADAAAWLRDAS
jgi:porphobilinogen synthase